MCVSAIANLLYSRMSLSVKLPTDISLTQSAKVLYSKLLIKLKQLAKYIWND